MSKGNGFDTPELKKLVKKDSRMRTVLKHLKTNDGRFGTPDNIPEPERRPGKESLSEHESKINLVGKDHRFEYLYEEMKDSKTMMHGSFSGFFGRKNSDQYNAVTAALGEVINRTNTVFKQFAGDNLRMMREASNAYFRLIEACNSYLEKDGGTTKSGAARKDRVKLIRKLAKNDITAVQQYYYDIKFGKISEEEQSKLNWQDIIFSGREATIEVDDLHDDANFKALGAKSKTGDNMSRLLKRGVFSKKETMLNDSENKSALVPARFDNKDNEIGNYGKKTNITNRNVATSRMAGLLGLSGLIAESKTVKVKDRKTGEVFKGNLMDFAEGEEATEVYNRELTNMRASKDSIESRFRKAQEIFAPSLQKEMSSLQILDYICGQNDRNTGNYMIKKDEHGRYAHVVGIDNDKSFGTGIDHAELVERTGMIGNMEKMRLVVDKNNNLIIPYMDKQLAKNIVALSADEVRFALKDLLEPQYIENTVQRLQKVQAGIKNEKYGWDSACFREDSEWTEYTGERLRKKSSGAKMAKIAASTGKNAQFGGMKIYGQSTYYGEFINNIVGFQNNKYV